MNGIYKIAFMSLNDLKSSIESEINALNSVIHHRIYITAAEKKIKLQILYIKCEINAEGIRVFTCCLFLITVIYFLSS